MKIRDEMFMRFLFHKVFIKRFPQQLNKIADLSERVAEEEPPKALQEEVI